MTARSYLYVPADRVDMLDKAVAGKADAVIADLEDGVAINAKDEARKILGEWAKANPPDSRLWVRVNADPERMAADIAAVAAAGFTGIYLPKATPETAAATADRIAEVDPGNTSIIALVESARGLAQVNDLAAIPMVSRLAIGEADLGADLGIDAASAESTWLPIRLQLVVASAAAGLIAPIGPVLTDFRNDERLRDSTTLLKQMGFGARSAIHPQQVSVINDVFVPSAEEVSAARDLIARFDEAQSSGSGVMIADDGTMADEATVRHARIILDQAARRSN